MRRSGPIQRKTPINRGKGLKRGRKRINPISDNEREQKRKKAKCITDYKNEFGTGYSGPCQLCGENCQWLDPAHKIRASKGRVEGDADPTNILALCRRCHTWLDSHISRYGLVVNCMASCATGGSAYSLFSVEQQTSLGIFKLEGKDIREWRGKPDV